MPGLKVVMPSTPADARGLLKAAIRDEKAEVEMEAPASGMLLEIVGEVKGVYPIGEVLAIIGAFEGG